MAETQSEPPPSSRAENDGTETVTEGMATGEPLVTPQHLVLSSSYGTPAVIQVDHEEPALGQEVEVVSIPTPETAAAFLKRAAGRPPSFMPMRPLPMTPRPQHTKTPSLLRRSRTVGPAHNPLLHHNQTAGQFLLCGAGGLNLTGVENNSGLGVPVHIETASILPPVSSFLKTQTPSPEEIVIWQPDPTDTCEIIEVQESDLANFLQQNKQMGGADFQQIIVCEDGSTDDAQFSG